MTELELELVDGWVEPELAEEFPELSLLHARLDVRPTKSPREVKQRLRMLADRYTGGKVVHMRQDPVPWAYRVFSRQVGIDPDTDRTPVEGVALRRLKHGGLRSENVVDDALTIAIAETGVPLIAFDGSDASRAGIKAAAHLLAVREAVIETVWIPYSGVGAGGVIGAPVAVASRAVDELDKTVAAHATQTAHDGARLAAAIGLEARAEATEAAGPVWCRLRDSAEAHGSPVIVVGSRGRGPFASSVLGSVSSALVHDARLPVLVVPPGDA